MLSPCYRFIQQLSEHLYARDYRLSSSLQLRPYDLYRILYLHRAALYASRRYRATARDREHVLYRHQERLVAVALRRRNVACLPLPSARRYGFAPFVGSLTSVPVLHRFQCFQRRPFDHRNVIARELVAAQQIPDSPSLPAPAALRRLPCRTLFMNTTMYGTPTCLASRMCSRVCGIGPSAAAYYQDRAIHLRRAL